jgi:hypothetical protein
MFRSGCKFALLLPVLAAGGCDIVQRPISLDTEGIEPAANYDGLAGVLASAVKARGVIDPDALEGAAASLDAQLKLLAVTGPTATAEKFPTDGHVLAYWYNARAAWSLKLLLEEGCPQEIAGRALYDRPLPVDAREMTLREIDSILARDADFRVAVAAPGVTTQDARLPKGPFAPEGIRELVAERFAAFIDDKARFVIDVREKRILVPPVLWQFRQRLIRAHRARYDVEGATFATALLGHLRGSPHRRLQDAVGYRLVEARSRKLVTCTGGS